jgi:hypothetical protein
MGLSFLYNNLLSKNRVKKIVLLINLDMEKSCQHQDKPESGTEGTTTKK